MLLHLRGFSQPQKPLSNVTVSIIHPNSTYTRMHKGTHLRHRKTHCMDEGKTEEMFKGVCQVSEAADTAEQQFVLL